MQVSGFEKSITRRALGKQLRIIFRKESYKSSVNCVPLEGRPVISQWWILQYIQATKCPVVRGLPTASCRCCQDCLVLNVSPPSVSALRIKVYP